MPLQPGKDLSPDQIASHLPIDQITRHGDPRSWTFLGEKHGSRVPAKSRSAPPGTVKVYEVWDDAFGKKIEVHYFEHLDQSVSGVKLVPHHP